MMQANTKAATGWVEDEHGFRECAWFRAGEVDLDAAREALCHTPDEANTLSVDDLAQADFAWKMHTNTKWCYKFDGPCDQEGESHTHWEPIKGEPTHTAVWRKDSELENRKPRGGATSRLRLGEHFEHVDSLMAEQKALAYLIAAFQFREESKRAQITDRDIDAARPLAEFLQREGSHRKTVDPKEVAEEIWPDLMGTATIAKPDLPGLLTKVFEAAGVPMESEAQ